MTDRWYRRYAWILIFAPAFLIFIGPFTSGYFGSSPDPFVIKTVTGMTLDQIGALNPRIVGFVLRAYQDIGLAWIAFSLMVMAVAAGPFRRGERFAWYLLWVFPAYWVGNALSFESQILNGQLGTNGLAQISLVAFLVMLVMTVLGLLLPYRKFFPKMEPAAPSASTKKESLAS